MSLATVTPAADGFDDFEFAALVAGLATQPLGEPLPDPEPQAVRTFRPSRAAERREAQARIDEALGIRRHRRGEREA